MKKAQKYRHPKIKLDTIAKLHTNGGEIIQSPIQCVYPAGLTVACDKNCAVQLLPESLTTIPGVITETLVEISSSHDSLRCDITATCQVIAVRRMSQETFLIDLDFTDIAVEMEHELNQLIYRKTCPEQLETETQNTPVAQLLRSNY